MLFFACAISCLCGFGSSAVPTAPALTADPLPVLATSNASPCGRQHPPPTRHCCYPDFCSAQVSPLTHARNQETVQASTWPLMAHRHDWASPQRPLPLPSSVFESHGPSLAQVFIPSSYNLFPGAPPPSWEPEEFAL